MPVSASGDPFRELARVLRKADKDIRVELRKEINRATKPVKEEIQKAAIEVLPRRGGLGAWVAANKTVTRTRLGGANPSVTIVTSKTTREYHSRRRAAASRGKGKKRFFDHSVGGVDMRAINNGRIRHPYWGRGLTPPDKVQLVPGRLGKGGDGFFDVAAQRTAPRAAAYILDAMKRAVDRMPPQVR